LCCVGIKYGLEKKEGAEGTYRRERLVATQEAGVTFAMIVADRWYVRGINKDPDVTLLGFKQADTLSTMSH